MRHSGLRSLGATVALLGGLVGLSACGDDAPADASGNTVTTDDRATGTPSATVGKSLPAGFPTDDIPLAHEPLLSATQGAAGGPFAWSVVMQSSRSVEALSAEVQKDYASWKSQDGTGTSLGDVSILHFTDDRYDVGVTIARTGGNVTLTYVVKGSG